MLLPADWSLTKLAEQNANLHSLTSLMKHFKVNQADKHFFVFLKFLNFFLDVTIYEPDADMIFNYLMVSALASATDIIEREGLKPSGGMYNMIYIYI